MKRGARRRKARRRRKRHQRRRRNGIVIVKGVRELSRKEGREKKEMKRGARGTEMERKGKRAQAGGERHHYMDKTRSEFKSICLYTCQQDIIHHGISCQ